MKTLIMMTKRKIFFSSLICVSLGIVLVPPLSRHMKAERLKAQVRAAATTLSFSRPSFQPLADFIKGTELSATTWSPFTVYFEKAEIFFPNLAEVQGMLGVCYFKQGETERSVAALKKAVAMNPDFFWHAYNLGVVYLRQKNYPAAEKMFRQAVALNGEATLKAIYLSGVYRPIWGLMHEASAEGMTRRLKQGYGRGYLFLGICLKAMGQEQAALEALGRARSLQEGNPSYLSEADDVDVQIF